MVAWWLPFEQEGDRVVQQETERGKRCWRCGEEEEMCDLPRGQVGDREEEEEAWVVSGKGAGFH